MTEASNVVAFPGKTRKLLALEAIGEDAPPACRQAVDHDGGLYPLEDLLRALTSDQLRTLEAAAPRSGQEAWDEVVRSWPALADEIAAGVPKTG